jgi:hypothetical protein
MKKSQAELRNLFDISKQTESVRVGKITHVDEDGQVFVNFAGSMEGPTTARFTSAVKLQDLRHAADSGRDVLLVFENNDPLSPIIIDTISSLIDEITQTESLDLKEEEEPKEVVIDGKRITFDAEEEVVIRCGKGSIILTRDGKIIVKGTNLLSRSSGPHRIKGASVNIN